MTPLEIEDYVLVVFGEKHVDFCFKIANVIDVAFYFGVAFFGGPVVDFDDINQGFDTFFESFFCLLHAKLS